MNDDDMVSEIPWLLANIILFEIIYGEGHCGSDLHLNCRSPMCQVQRLLGKRPISSFMYPAKVI